VKAIVVRQFGEPDVMHVEEIGIGHPGSGQVRVRIAAAGVNPVDTYVRKGVYARKPALPYTPGADAAGTIDCVGPDVTTFAPHDRVYITGTTSGPYGAYAELAICQVSQVHPLPDGVSFAQGAAIGVPYGTAYRALFQRGKAQPGETVLIHGGSGGVGTAAIQLARAAGLRVFATAGSPRGLELVRSQGADHVFNHTTADYGDRVVAATGGHGVDLVLEMLANVNLNRDLAVVARGGRVVVIGSRGTVEIDPRLIMAKDADVRGMILFNTSPEDMAGIHAALGAGLRLGTIKPVIGHEFPFADAPRAHETVMSPGSQGKIVLKLHG
jgi:NADPH:quinone reductase